MANVDTYEHKILLDRLRLNTGAKIDGGVVSININDLHHLISVYTDELQERHWEDLAGEDL